MKPVIHIGPPKTASTALQRSVIPNLGRPFTIKPDWVRQLVKKTPHFEKPVLPPDAIVSDESLGEFLHIPPTLVAERLATIFTEGIVVYVVRDPVDLFHSLHRQRVINKISVSARLLIEKGRMIVPMKMDQAFDESVAEYKEKSTGFLAMANTKVVQTAFQRHFEVRLIDFDLLKKDPSGFSRAFCTACDSTTTHNMDVANESSIDALESVLALLPAGLSPDILNLFRASYTVDRLSEDRADYLRKWIET